MIKADCGCYIIPNIPSPIIQLVCDEHTASEVYGGYDGKVDEVCDYLLERIINRGKSQL